MPRPNDGAWFHVVLVLVPVASIVLLREQRRKPKDERVSVKTHTVRISRFTGHDANAGVRGVRRVSVQPNADAIDIKWVQPMPHGSGHARTSVAFVGKCTVLEFGDYLVLAQAFTNEADAKAWAKERHEMPLPQVV